MIPALLSGVGSAEAAAPASAPGRGRRLRRALRCVPAGAPWALAGAVGGWLLRSGRRRPAAGDVPALPSGTAPVASSVLDCAVCLSDLVLPRVTPCGHTLCTPCLGKLAANSRRTFCPVCRARIKVSVDRLPINFAVKALVEANVAARGEEAWAEYCAAEESARAGLEPCSTAGSASSGGRRGFVAAVRPAWNWFKWSVIIVTELGAFLVSLKEVLEAAPNRTRRYQRIV